MRSRGSSRTWTSRSPRKPLDHRGRLDAVRRWRLDRQPDRAIAGNCRSAPRSRRSCAAPPRRGFRRGRRHRLPGAAPSGPAAHRTVRRAAPRARRTRDPAARPTKPPGANSARPVPPPSPRCRPRDPAAKPCSSYSSISSGNCRRMPCSSAWIALAPAVAEVHGSRRRERSGPSSAGVRTPAAAARSVSSRRMPHSACIIEKEASLQIGTDIAQVIRDTLEFGHDSTQP